MQANISHTLSDRRTRKDISGVFSELSKGNYSNIDSFGTEDVFGVLSRLKINTDFINLLINIFGVTQNEELKSKVAIGILYYSIGSESMVLYSTKLSIILDYTCAINPENLDDLLAGKIEISGVRSQKQKNRIREVIEFWRKNKFLTMKVRSAVDKQLTSSAND